MLRLWLLHLLLLAGLFCPRALHAQPPAPEARETAAYKEAIHHAIEEFERGNFAEARAQFARAHALYPNARTLRGLGMSDFELRNYVAAVANLERALASQEKPLEGTLQEETGALLSRARTYVAEVKLELTPKDALLRIDGAPVELAPGRNVRLTVGDHVLEVSAPGYLSERHPIRVYEQALTVTVKLTELESSAPARAAPSAATSADKDDRATKPLYKRWWLWTSVGAVVAAGVITGVVLATRKTEVADPDQGSTGALFTVGD